MSKLKHAQNLWGKIMLGENDILYECITRHIRTTLSNAGQLARTRALEGLGENWLCCCSTIFLYDPKDMKSFALFYDFQVEGSEAVKKLKVKLRSGPTVLYHGSLAAAAATAVGHFPWFYTFNTLQEYIPKVLLQCTFRIYENFFKFPTFLISF